MRGIPDGTLRYLSWAIPAPRCCVYRSHTRSTRATLTVPASLATWPVEAPGCGAVRGVDREDCLPIHTRAACTALAPGTRGRGNTSGAADVSSTAADYAPDSLAFNILRPGLPWTTPYVEFQRTGNECISLSVTPTTVYAAFSRSRNWPCRPTRA